MQSREQIEIRGACANNLKHIDVEIPKEKLVVLAGVSGSGKSSLAFDTIAEESGRQWQSTYPLYLRNRLPRHERPPVEDIRNLTPCVVVDQQPIGANARSTVGTAVDAAPLLRLLFSRVGRPSAGGSMAYSMNHPHGMCPDCTGLGVRVQLDEERMFDREKSIREGAIRFSQFSTGSWQSFYYYNNPQLDPDKKLRDFTREEWQILRIGPDTPLVMDYARNNYVAQPGDGVTQLLPPHLGLYDYYAIKWAYQPIFEAKTPEEEVPVLNRWIDEKADDPIYIYGEQAIFGATDPASQTESLGDDAMKATEYGIRNLKIVVDSLHLWTAYPGKDYNRTEKLYEEVFKQARRYLGHVMVYLGGSYRYYPMVGSDQPAFEMVSKQKQKEALNFIFDKLYELPDWYVNPQLEKLTRPKNEDVTDYQMSTVRTLLLPGRIARMETNAKLTPEDAYSASEYVDDIYNRVWASTLKNKPLSHSERMMQYAFVQSMLRGIDALDKESSLRGLTDYPAEDEGAFWPCRHIECGRHGNGFEDQMTGSTRATDVQLYATSLCYNQLRKLGKLLRARVQSSTDELAEHYRYLNYEIEKALEKGL